MNRSRCDSTDCSRSVRRDSTSRFADACAEIFAGSIALVIVAQRAMEIAGTTKSGSPANSARQMRADSFPASTSQASKPVTGFESLPPMIRPSFRTRPSNSKRSGAKVENSSSSSRRRRFHPISSPSQSALSNLLPSRLPERHAYAYGLFRENDTSPILLSNAPPKA